MCHVTFDSSMFLCELLARRDWTVCSVLCMTGSVWRTLLLTSVSFVDRAAACHACWQNFTRMPVLPSVGKLYSLAYWPKNKNTLLPVKKREKKKREKVQQKLSCLLTKLYPSLSCLVIVRPALSFGGKGAPLHVLIKIPHDQLRKNARCNSCCCKHQGQAICP